MHDMFGRLPMAEAIVVNGRSFKVDAGKNKTFWDAIKSRRWETETFNFFQKNIEPTALVLDVGAWIGPTALYAAQLGARCVAFEPDPVAFKELQANYEANRGADWFDRLTIENSAITLDGRPLVLGSRSKGGDSTSSALFADSDTNWTVSSRRLGDVLREYSSPGQPVFIKIDIEGGEYALLPEMGDVLGRAGASFHISLHPSFLRKSLRKKYASLPWPLRFVRVRFEFVRLHRRVLVSLPVNRTVNILSSIPKGALLAVAAITGRFPKDVRIEKA